MSLPPGRFRFNSMAALQRGMLTDTDLLKGGNHQHGSNVDSLAHERENQPKCENKQIFSYLLIFSSVWLPSFSIYGPPELRNARKNYFTGEW